MRGKWTEDHNNSLPPTRVEGQGQTDRSARREVRNPVLSLPGAQRLLALSPEAREAVQAILGDIAKDAADRAQKSWRQNKGPMAAYWKAVSVYAKHIRAVVNSARKLREVA